MVTATLYTATGCGPCRFAARDLDTAGIEYEVRDVRLDADAEEDVIALYARLRPGMVPSAPVAVLGGETLFGATEIHQHIRDMAKAVAA